MNTVTFIAIVDHAVQKMCTPDSGESIHAQGVTSQSLVKQKPDYAVAHYIAVFYLAMVKKSLSGEVQEDVLYEIGFF